MSKNDCRQQQVSFDQPATASDKIRNMHDIFANSYRCAILSYLQQVDGTVSLQKVTRVVDQRSPGGERAENEYGDRPEVWLRDDHLRPMDEFGVVVYDSENDVVRLPEDVSFSVADPWTSA